MTRVMQPVQCELQAQIPKHPITTHTQAHPKQLEATVTMRQKKGKPTPAATAAQTRYLSSSPAATLHGKTQGFVLPLPPQNIAQATSSSHYDAVRSINSQTCTYLRTEQDQNSVTTSLPHHFPSSPPTVIATTSHVPTSLPHHSPSSPLPFLTTSLPHHVPSSPPPFLTTFLRHHFASSPHSYHSSRHIKL
jgi:hypothetical protein